MSKLGQKYKYKRLRLRQKTDMETR